jgi:hypothetical protein
MIMDYYPLYFLQHNADIVHKGFLEDIRLFYDTATKEIVGIRKVTGEMKIQLGLTFPDLINVNELVPCYEVYQTGKQISDNATYCFNC